MILDIVADPDWIDRHKNEIDFKFDWETPYSNIEIILNNETFLRSKVYQNFGPEDTFTFTWGGISKTFYQEPIKISWWAQLKKKLKRRAEKTIPTV